MSKFEFSRQNKNFKIPISSFQTIAKFEFSRQNETFWGIFQILCKKDFYCKIDPKLIHKSRKQIYDLPCWKYSEKNTSAHSFLIQFFWGTKPYFHAKCHIFLGGCHMLHQAQSMLIGH